VDFRGRRIQLPQHTGHPRTCPCNTQLSHSVTEHHGLAELSTNPCSAMKGMVGICLHPGKSYVEAKVRLYNRTPFAQTFLWWPLGIRYTNTISIFPPDVTYVADHAKRAISSFRLLATFTTVSITEKAWTSPGTRTFLCPPRTWSRNQNTIFWRVRSPEVLVWFTSRTIMLLLEEALDMGQRRIRIRLGPKPHRC